MSLPYAMGSCEERSEGFRCRLDGCCSRRVLVIAVSGVVATRLWKLNMLSNCTLLIVDAMQR
jgi:hypothetical protein